MAKDIPDYLREYDLDQDWGFTPVSKAPESTPAVDTSVIETNNVELAKVKSDVGDIKSMMNEIMQIVAEKDKVTQTLESEDFYILVKNKIDRTGAIFRNTNQ